MHLTLILLKSAIILLSIIGINVNKFPFQHNKLGTSALNHTLLWKYKCKKLQENQKNWNQSAESFACLLHPSLSKFVTDLILYSIQNAKSFCTSYHMHNF